ncbi:hypothetical protein [Cohnella sp.]|uniref:hypothetical protein n=1 Tax=Cohnella sp. TaxID=1883426 RepID=UPI0035623AB4
MESTKSKKKWITLLLTATMSVVLLFGATACSSKAEGDGDVVVGDEAPDATVPAAESEAPASPSAS